uniref:Beta-lactamase-related domain-containing protein n=1 Tax=Haptolina ericina TaxID=156174 RepID=A0A7S3AKE5_9EUKA|mmetsp:Transcript_20592/g.45991  ORF Transcript_20592/g.45991 Transcript_20592/m.45991 type:complete len:102 (+) Transcript_20592:233-538(+)
MYAASTETGYGLATFNLTHLTPHDTAYGHLGATYGYQSVVVYVPGLQLSIAIGTNIERDDQDQPQDVFCSVYNTIKATLSGSPAPTCTFKRGYFDGGCKCK